MQHRHLDRYTYFSELDRTTERFIIPYVMQHLRLSPGADILEIGCGEGGNLMPFARRGCRTTGIDISATRILQAKEFFVRNDMPSAEFIRADVFSHDFGQRKFDLIICHDVIEHISNKSGLLQILSDLLKPDGAVFMAFPPWTMPFGGHQQICHGRLISSCPFIHLLPMAIYVRLLRAFNEPEECIRELIRIKQTGISTRHFRHLIGNSRLKLVCAKQWLVNPHYEQKFGLRPRAIFQPLGRLSGISDFLTTSYWSILKI